jgi:predicted acyltransferase
LRCVKLSPMNKPTPSVDVAKAVAVAAPAKEERLGSLDALRGFDMLMIAAADAIIEGLHKASDSAPVQFIVGQFTHKKWEGFAFYDLIFPLFVFMAGVSIVYSLDKALERGGAGSAAWRVSRRAVVLFFLGVFYNGGISHGFTQIRWMGVLQRISIAYLFASLIYLLCARNWKVIAGVTVAILVAYWGILSFVPVPGQSEVSFEEGKNIVNYLDIQYLPGKKYDGQWDPEGLLSNLPAIATCLLGVLSGMLLKNPNIVPQRKAITLLVAGAALVALGFLWGLQFPVVKKLWTSSYVLVAGGYSMLLLGAFYQVIDIWKFRRGIGPLIWVGANALTIYLLTSIMEFSKISQKLFGGAEIKGWMGSWHDAFIGLVSAVLIIALAGFLYRRKIFIRV